MNKSLFIVLLICSTLMAVSCGLGKSENANKNTGELLTNGLTSETLQLAVSLAIKDRGKGYLAGENLTEGHIILDRLEENGTVKVYTLASVGWFGFENGIFTKISGSGAIPTIITFSQEKQGEYSFLGYKEPIDGSGYIESIKEMFPMKLWEKILNTQSSYPELARQQEIQAEAYLKTIGRTARVSAAYVEKKLVKINVQASNRLLAEQTKQDSFLNNCPYWLGTRERIESGVRYIYETSQSKTHDGYDLITFRKLKEDGSLIAEKKYKIVESEPQLIN